MKKLTVLISILGLIGLLGAIDIEHSGEFRTRSAALYDDASENLDNYIDSRMRLNLDGKITENLGFRAGLQAGDWTWGDPLGGNLHLSVNEAFIDYRLDILNANILVGKQYWADHRGLIMDDYFSGAMLKMDDISGFKGEFILMKFPMGADNSTWYIANMATETLAPVPFGFTAFAGYKDDVEMQSISVLPYATIEGGPVIVDLTGFIDYQYSNEKLGMGATMKATAEVENMTIIGDVLVAMENGLTTISPWYMNGLYLYGIGSHHDGVNKYWQTPYQYNPDVFISAVGQLKYGLTEDMKVFGAAGYLTDLGLEVNGGVEYQVIPEKMSVNGFGAFGLHDNETMDLLFGASVEVVF